MMRKSGLLSQAPPQFPPNSLLWGIWNTILQKFTMKICSRAISENYTYKYKDINIKDILKGKIRKNMNELLKLVNYNLKSR